MPPRNVVFLIVATVASLASWFARHRDLRGHRVNEVLTHIAGSYIEPVDGEMLVDAAVQAAVSRLDENSAFLRPADRRDLESVLDQRFGGVGLELGMASRDGEAGEPRVVAAIVGGPAWRADVGADDRIVAVDGAATRGRPLEETVQKLRGMPGSEVVIRVVPATAGAGATAPSGRDVQLVREVIRVESVQGDRRNADGSWDWFLEGEPGVAYLRLTGFGERTVEEFDAALASIGAAEMVRGLVIDLRGNPGGLLAPAIEVCDRYLDDGVIVSLRGRSADRDPGLDTRRARLGTALAEVPVAVLIDGLTASSAEIVAACLQDHGRATVVGSRSFGKGTVQSILPLSDGAALKLTTSQYRRPGGGRIHRRPEDGPDALWGVSPDTGFDVSPSSLSLERLRDWRRRRDVPRPRPEDGRGPDGAEALPTEVDEVLARAVEIFAPSSNPVPQLGREEETAGHADHAPRPGV
jgi:carboxyl-terminal processing protease